MAPLKKKIKVFFFLTSHFEELEVFLLDEVE